MKSYIFATAFLGSVGIASAAEYPSVVMDTWCITYLSTYLVPISAPPGLPSSRQLTFFGNSSTAIISRTRDQSFNAPESQTTALVDLSSAAAALTEAQTDSEIPSTALITGSLTEPIVTSSAIPTSTGIVEPPGRSVIFLIQETTDNQKRDINKRATGGFVGADNPDICTFALTFNLAEDQLYSGGSPTFYAGEGFKPLGYQGDDTLPQGAIAKTFATSGRTLVFRNSGLPNGEAGFCQDASGQTYITFTSSPTRCIPVLLGVYDVEECQDGRLVGVETSTSPFVVSSEVSTIESVSSGESTAFNPFTSSELSNTLSETSIVMPTTTSSDIINSPTSTQSPNPSSDSSTEALSSTEPHSPTSRSGASTEITSIASEDSISESSSEVTTSGEEIPTTSTTASESSLQTIASTTETIATSSELLGSSNSIISTSEGLGVETTNADETSSTQEATLPVPTTIAESSTEATITDTTTEATISDTTTETAIPDTTTELTVTTTAASEPSSCAALSNPYTDGGSTFDLSCNSRVTTGTSIGNVQANSFQQCVFFCAQASNCAAIAFTKSSNNCQGFSSLDGTVADDLFDVAIKQVVLTPADAAPI